MAYRQTAAGYDFMLYDSDYDQAGQLYNHFPYHGNWNSLPPATLQPFSQPARMQTFPFQHNVHKDFFPQQPLMQEWPYYDINRTFRGLSPSGSSSSGPSDISSCGEPVFMHHVAAQPIRSSASPIDLQSRHTFTPMNEASLSGMSWQPAIQSRFTSQPVQTVVPAFLPTQSPLPMKDYELGQDEDSTLDAEFEGDVTTIHQDHSQQVPSPEEIELSEVTTLSTASSTSGDHLPESITSETPERMQSDNEDDEEDSMAVDNDSDSDFTTRPKRRTNSRTGSARNIRPPIHTRKPSNQSVLGTKSRVHRRSNSMQTTTSTTQSHVRQPSKSKPKSKGPIFTRKPSLSTQSATPKSDRVFPCTFRLFGCPLEFGSKNEWKRHVTCQHLQLGYFRCDLDDCDPDTHSTEANTRKKTPSPPRRIGSAAKKHNNTFKVSEEEEDSNTEEIIKIYNDFNRKDLFTQHCRRMHGPARNPELCQYPMIRKNGSLVPAKEDEAAFEHQLDLIRKRCWHVRRKAPSRSNCPHCDHVYDAYFYKNYTHADGQGPEERAWEERMEHLGRHYEKENVRKEDEEIDEDLVKWGLETGVFKKLDDGRVWLKHADLPPAGDGSDRGNVEEEDEGQKKARRQPSRTVVVQRCSTAVSRTSAKNVKAEEDVDTDSDEDADGETE